MTPESSVVAHMLADENVIGPVLGELVAASHFIDPAYKAIFAQIVDAWHDDRSTDAVAIGALTAQVLARAWSCEAQEASARVQSLAQQATGNPLEHARLVRRNHDYRELAKLATQLQRDVSIEHESPDELSGRYAAAATRISVGSLRNTDLVSFGDLGRDFVSEQQRVMDNYARGIDTGVMFGLPIFDNHTRGIQPTELYILGGPPGGGKSAVAWKGGLKFAERQYAVDEADRIGVMVASLEMGRRPSQIRLAQSLAGIEGGTFREGSNTSSDLKLVRDEWGRRRRWPLYFLFQPTLKASQLKAFVVEGIRKHNIGLLIIDHMRYFDMDGRWSSKLEEDEEKARFLKQSLAKELDIAVMCLAHTTKAVDDTEDRKPRLSHLRGSGQIAAEADFVAFLHRPYNGATEQQKADGEVSPTEAQLIYAKNRHQPDTTADFNLDPSTLAIY
jgi:replicative DNA helicase